MFSLEEAYTQRRTADTGGGVHTYGGLLVTQKGQRIHDPLCVCEGRLVGHSLRSLYSAWRKEAKKPGSE